MQLFHETGVAIQMNKRDAVGITVSGAILLTVGISWLVKYHQKAMDAQCIYNLASIDGPKQQWALETNQPTNAFPTIETLSPYRNNDPMPICPRGGTYTIGRVGASTTCSFKGHSLDLFSEELIDKYNIHYQYPYNY